MNLIDCESEGLIACATHTWTTVSNKIRQWLIDHMCVEGRRDVPLWSWTSDLPNAACRHTRTRTQICKNEWIWRDRNLEDIYVNMWKNGKEEQDKWKRGMGRKFFFSFWKKLVLFFTKNTENVSKVSFTMFQNIYFFKSTLFFCLSI